MIGILGKILGFFGGGGEKYLPKSKQFLQLSLALRYKYIVQSFYYTEMIRIIFVMVTAVLFERAFSHELILLDNGEVVEKVLVSSSTQSSLPNRPQDSQSPSSPQDNINPTNENTRLYITLGIVLIVALVIS